MRKEIKNNQKNIIKKHLRLSQIKRKKRKKQ